MSSYVAIVNCSCKTSVYVGGKKKKCPSCEKTIIEKNDEYFIEEGNIPLLCIKFHPSSLSYFNSVFPEIGRFIIIIDELGKVEYALWSDELERECYEGINLSKYFAWLKA